MSSRRGLFKMLGAVAVSPAVSKLEKFIPIPAPPPVSPEEILQKLAAEMASRLGLTLDYLVRVTYDGSAIDPLIIEKFSPAEYLLP